MARFAYVCTNLCCWYASSKGYINREIYHAGKYQWIFEQGEHECVLFQMFIW